MFGYFWSRNATLGMAALYLVLGIVLLLFEQKQHNAQHKIQGRHAQCGIAGPEISKHINSSCWAAWRPGCKCMANARPPCSGQGTYIVRPLSVYHTYRAA